ncbi:MAG: hypothetical protein HY721_05835 [Planctomycetes bacterium]|nr:hypothetical protein [Planctomycetota bacterium]
MESCLKDVLRELEILEPAGGGSLQVFGVRRPERSRLEYATLDEALASGSFEVTEVSEGGSVPVLKVSNRGDASVLLVAGEELVGAKQNRVLNTSVLVGARSDLPIPVSCVEAGRWRYASRAFASARSSSHSKLRALMAKQVHGSYKASGTAGSDQGAVWGEVSRKLGALKSRSPTFALHQVYEDHDARLAKAVEQLGVPEDCSGAVFAVNGSVAGAVLFDRPSTLRKLWSKLVKSYALDAFEAPEAPLRAGRAEAASWLERALATPGKSFKSPGLGSDVRLETPELVGASLVVDGEPVHTEVFAQSLLS